MNKDISSKNTKNEILEAYEQALKDIKQLNTKTKQQALELKKQDDLLANAQQLTQAGLGQSIHDFKTALNATLDKLATDLHHEQEKLESLRQANQLAKSQLNEQHDILKEADTLDALLLAHKRKQIEIEETTQAQRDHWKKVQQAYETEHADKQLALEKQRQQEDDNYNYQLKLKRQKEDDAYRLKKQAQDNELIAERDAFEKEIAEREQSVVESEEKLHHLEKEVAAFPKRLASDIEKAIKDTTEKLTTQFEYERKLSEQRYEGELALYKQTNHALESTLADQKHHMDDLNQKLALASQQVQDIALHAIEGNSKSKQPITITTSNDKQKETVTV